MLRVPSVCLIQHPALRTCQSQVRLVVMVLQVVMSRPGLCSGGVSVARQIVINTVTVIVIVVIIITIIVIIIVITIIIIIIDVICHGWFRVLRAAHQSKHRATGYGRLCESQPNKHMYIYIYIHTYT